MTFETFDQLDLWKISRVFKDFQIFGDNNSNKDNPKICDTDYNSDNWEPEFMTIFVTWQLIVTLDSIRNSCDVLLP